MQPAYWYPTLDMSCVPSCEQVALCIQLGFDLLHRWMGLGVSRQVLHSTPKAKRHPTTVWSILEQYDTTHFCIRNSQSKFHSTLCTNFHHRLVRIHTFICLSCLPMTADAQPANLSWFTITSLSSSRTLDCFMTHEPLLRPITSTKEPTAREVELKHWSQSLQKEERKPKKASLGGRVVVVM